MTRNGDYDEFMVVGYQAVNPSEWAVQDRPKRHACHQLTREEKLDRLHEAREVCIDILAIVVSVCACTAALGFTWKLLVLLGAI
jgi:hypothetical protein